MTANLDVNAHYVDIEVSRIALTLPICGSNRLDVDRMRLWRIQMKRHADLLCPY